MRAALVLTAVISAAAAVAGQGAPPQLAPKPVLLKPGAAAIFGRVVEAGGTAAVNNAIVSLYGDALGPPNVAFSDGTPGGRRQAVTDGDGQFIFRNLPAGLYNLDSEAPGFVDGSYGDARPALPARLLDVRRGLEIVESDRVVSAQLQMWRLGGISGTVRDDLGEPIVGASVAILGRGSSPAGPTLRRVLMLATDDRGMFHADVAPDDYLVAVYGATSTIPNWAVELMQEAVVDGASPAVLAYKKQILVGGFPVTGTGMRVGAFTISRRDTTTATPLPPLVWVNGRLMLFPTTYYPASRTAAGGSLVKLQSGAEVSGVDIQVPLIEARSVSGHVSGPNGAVPAIAMLLIPSDPALATSSPVPLLDTPQTMADGSGNFTFVGVAPGSYTLRAAMPEPATPLHWSLQQVVVPADSDVNDLRVVVREGIRVSGRIVVDAAVPRTPNPEQLRAVNVRLTPVPGSNGAFLGSMLYTSGSRPDETRFITAATAMGQHLINVIGLPAGWLVKTITLGAQNVIDKPIDLTADLADVVVTITDRVSLLAGQVRDTEGRPSSSSTVTVVVFPVDRSLWPPVGMGSRRVRTSSPSRSGRYSFRGLPAGTYAVAAVETTADLSDPAVLASLVSSNPHVTIGDGDSPVLDLRVVKR